MIESSTGSSLEGRRHGNLAEADAAERAEDEQGQTAAKQEHVYTILGFLVIIVVEWAPKPDSNY